MDKSYRFIRVAKNILDPIITEAIQRFKFTAEAEYPNRVAMKSDLDFYAGNQWDQGLRNDRVSSSRPSLTINRLPQFVRQITNGLRQNMPQVRAIPVNDSDEEVADILSGIMRHIQDNSHASVAYASANQSQVTAGKGYFRVITDYISDDSFDQEIYIKRIKNPLSVYVDPNSVEPDESDANFKFITFDITHNDFEREYPGKQAINNDDLVGYGDSVKEWLTDEKSTMRLAEYWTIEEKPAGKLYQLEDGSIVKEVPEGIEAVREKEYKERKVIFRIISAVEVVKEIEWAGKYIPIVPVIGEDLDIDGTRIIKGMVRDSQDPQRMYNYLCSAEVETIALAPKAPYIAALGQIEGLKEIWAQANTMPYSVLPYNPVVNGGVAVPPPQRQTAEAPIAALSTARAQFSEDLKATTGIYDAGLGARSNEVSGKAIDARKIQGDLSNYHYVDNFSYSLEFLGKILIDLIPKIYDTQRVVRILGEDGTSQYKTINGPSGEKDVNGVEKIYDVTTGEFAVVVDTGPSYKTKRQQDSDAMATLLKGNPELWQVAGDLFVKAMDWPDAQQLSERLKKTLPPNLQEDDPSKEIPLQVKQQLDQYGQLVEQLSATVHQLQDEKEAKVLELESKERIALEDNINKIVIEAIKSETKAAHTLLTAELKGITDRLNMLNVNQPINSQDESVSNNNSQIDNVNNTGTME